MRASLKITQVTQYITYPRSCPLTRIHYSFVMGTFFAAWELANVIGSQSCAILILSRPEYSPVIFPNSNRNGVSLTLFTSKQDDEIVKVTNIHFSLHFSMMKVRTLPRLERFLLGPLVCNYDSSATYFGRYVFS